MTTTWIALALPRALRATEFAVLKALVAHTGCEQLTEQLATVRVTGTCGCGCSSVRLETDGPRIPAKTMKRLGRRDDYFGVHATAPGDPDVDTVAHVADGRLVELELYAGEALPVKPPAATRLRDFWTG